MDVRETIAEALWETSTAGLYWRGASDENRERYLQRADAIMQAIAGTHTLVPNERWEWTKTMNPAILCSPHSYCAGCNTCSPDCTCPDRDDD